MPTRIIINVNTTTAISIFTTYLGTEDSREEMKRMILETNFYLLITTMTVSTLHMVFEFLAFKNDVTFWKTREKNKNTEGLSVTALFIGAISQLIIFLYLLDNETSWMVIFSAGTGVIIDFWKVCIITT